jgi:3-deoxy-manno-octulosonate cytidylyltransferase (CMP-KDO synthetase)
MIEHVYRRAQAVRAIDAVIVATDDERIVRAVAGFGGIARMTRASHASGTDRVAEVVETLACDIVVNIQGDLPVIEPAMIEQAIAPLVHDPSIVMSTLRRELTDPRDVSNLNVVKVVVDGDGFALYFSRAPIPFHRDPDQSVSSERRIRWYKHIGLYVYRRDFLLRFARLAATPLERAESLEQLRAIEHGYRIKTVETIHDSIEIDTAEDLEKVRRLVGVDVASNGVPAARTVRGGAW